MHSRPIIPVEQASTIFLSVYGKTFNIRERSPAVRNGTCLIWNGRFEDRTDAIMNHAGGVGRKLKTLCKDLRFFSIIQDLLRSPGAYDCVQRDLPFMALGYFIASRFKDQDLKAAAHLDRMKLRPEFEELLFRSSQLCTVLQGVVNEIWTNPDADDEERQYLQEIEGWFCSERVSLLGSPSAEESVMSGIDFSLPMEFAVRANRNTADYIENVLSVVTHAFRSTISKHCTPEQTGRMFLEVSAAVRDNVPSYRSKLIEQLKENFNVSNEYAVTLSKLSAIRRTGSGPRSLVSADEADNDLVELDPIAVAQAAGEFDEPRDDIPDGPTVTVGVRQ